MRDIDGTVKISIKDYEYLKSQEKHYEELLKKFASCIAIDKIENTFKNSVICDNEKLTKTLIETIRKGKIINSSSVENEFFHIIENFIENNIEIKTNKEL